MSALGFPRALGDGRARKKANIERAIALVEVKRWLKVLDECTSEKLLYGTTVPATSNYRGAFDARID